jgi:hypothetical protein
MKHSHTRPLKSITRAVSPCCRLPLNGAIATFADQE